MFTAVVLKLFRSCPPPLFLSAINMERNERIQIYFGETSIYKLLLVHSSPVSLNLVPLYILILVVHTPPAAALGEPTPQFENHYSVLELFNRCSKQNMEDDESIN